MGAGVLVQLKRLQILVIIDHVNSYLLVLHLAGDYAAECLDGGLVQFGGGAIAAGS